jgi:hypothetical protein
VANPRWLPWADLGKVKLKLNFLGNREENISTSRLKPCTSDSTIGYNDFYNLVMMQTL